MIKVPLTIDEIVDILVTNAKTTEDALVFRLKQALAAATHQPVSLSITGFSDRGIIPPIKVLRNQFGWGLKEAKDFCDGIRGSYQPGGYFAGGESRTIAVPAGDLSKFTAELTASGTYFTVLDN